MQYDQPYLGGLIPSYGSGVLLPHLNYLCLHAILVEPSQPSSQTPLDQLCLIKLLRVVFFTSCTLDTCLDVIKQLLLQTFSREEVRPDTPTKWAPRSHFAAVNLCTNIESKVQGTTLQTRLSLYSYCKMNISLTIVAELIFLNFLLCSKVFYTFQQCE